MDLFKKFILKKQIFNFFNKFKNLELIVCSLCPKDINLLKLKNFLKEHEITLYLYHNNYLIFKINLENITFLNKLENIFNIHFLFFKYQNNILNYHQFINIVDNIKKNTNNKNLNYFLKNIFLFNNKRYVNLCKYTTTIKLNNIKKY
jgi:hypothetical protein